MTAPHYVRHINRRVHASRQRWSCMLLKNRCPKRARARSGAATTTRLREGQPEPQGTRSLPEKRGAHHLAVLHPYAVLVGLPHSVLLLLLLRGSRAHTQTHGEAQYGGGRAAGTGSAAAWLGETEGREEQTRGWTAHRDDFGDDLSARNHGRRDVVELAIGQLAAHVRVADSRPVAAPRGRVSDASRTRRLHAWVGVGTR